MDAGVEKFAGPEMSFEIVQGIHPMWAWYSFWLLMLICMVLLIWYEKLDRYK